jgi:hypothetical protein
MSTFTSLKSVKRSWTINVGVEYIISCSGRRGLELVEMRSPEEVSTLERYSEPSGARGWKNPFNHLLSRDNIMVVSSYLKDL